MYATTGKASRTAVYVTCVEGGEIGSISDHMFPKTRLIYLEVRASRLPKHEPEKLYRLDTA